MASNNKKFKNILVYLYFLVLSIQNVVAQSENVINSVSYQIKPNLKKKILCINVKFYGDFKYIQKIDLPYKWADENYSATVNKIRIQNFNEGFSIDKKDGNVLVLRPQKQTDMIEMNYEVHLSKQNQEFNLMKLIIYNNFIYSPGTAILALPIIKSSKNLKVSILWSDIPKNWEVQSSYGTGKSQEFYSTIFQLSKSAFVLGQLRTSKVSLYGKCINFSLYGSFDFIDKNIIEIATNVIKSQRKFFNNYEFNNYSVIVVENPTKSNNSASMGGNLMYNTSAIHLTKKISQTQLKILLAHEHLHNWINPLFSNEETTIYWWSEGFTEYYARVLSFRYGIISLNEFISEMNDILNEYYNSAFINISNFKISRQFWNNYNISRIPYLRGLLFALSLNCKIRLAKQDLSIDNILKYFTDRQQSIVFSNKNFVKAFENINMNIIKPKIEKYFYDTIIKGKTILLDDCLCQLPITHITKSQNINSSYSIISNLSNQQNTQLLNFFQY